MELWITIILANIVIMYLFMMLKIYINLKYQRKGDNDYIIVNVYIFKKIVEYSMQVPVVEMIGDKNSFWLKSKIKAGASQDETHIKREQRFVKKNISFYIKHPRKIKYIIRLIRHYMHLYCRVMDKVINSLHCEQLYWKTVYGSEDAAITGTMTGMLWTVKSLIMTRLKQHVVFMEKPIINVSPTFGENRLEVDFQCIFSMRLGNVINALRKMYNIKM